MLSANTHELLSICLLGFSTLFVMSGYDTQAFIVESVLHSVHRRNPDQMDGHAGYYGSTVLYGTYTLSTLIVPWICYTFGSRWTLTIGSFLFTGYLAGFFFLNSTYYYLSQAFMGLGFALYYCGQGSYISEHSSRKTISRNSVLISAIGSSSMLLGGTLLVFIFSLNKSAGSSTTDNESDEPMYRDFLDGEIKLIYGCLLALSIISNILFMCLPTKQYNSLAQASTVRTLNIKSQMSLLVETLLEPKMLFLVPFCVFYGLHIAFWVASFPTTFSFTASLANNPMIVAYYSAMIGIGNIIVGVYIHVMSGRNASFGLMPTMYSQMFLTVFLYGLTVLVTPNRATFEPTADAPLWMDPNMYTCLILGLLNGMVDCCSCTMRSIICTIALPEQRLQSYSIAKLFQSLATCLGSFLGPHLTIYGWVGLLLGVHIASALGFSLVCKLIHADENRKIQDVGQIFPMENTRPEMDEKQMI